jgi:L-ascorbate metabolism protein UlaG (beta-lactamase superfamily)
MHRKWQRREAIGALLGAPVLGQTYLSSPRRAMTGPELKDAPDEWIERSLQWVDDMLAKNPPGREEHPVRRAALIRLDDILHIESAPGKRVVQSWYAKRMAEAARRIAVGPPVAGARITKLYNHTFFVQTRAVAFVYDLVPGPPRMPDFAMSAETLGVLAEVADAHFISHWHDDHASTQAAEVFLAKGKPVLGPEDIWREKPELRKKLISPPRAVKPLRKIGKLEYVALPGHQGADVINNCNLVRTPEGLTFLQTGDQSNDQDFAWIDSLHKEYAVDVLFPNCWTPSPLRLLEGVKPKLVIPGHENEMAHVVAHREDWTQTYNRFHGAAALVAPMAWGESLVFGG